MINQVETLNEQVYITENNQVQILHLKSKITEMKSNYRYSIAILRLQEKESANLKISGYKSFTVEMKEKIQEQKELIEGYKASLLGNTCFATQ